MGRRRFAFRLASARGSRTLPPGWIGPASTEGTLPSASTVIGTIGSPRRATVDPRGLLTPASGGWSLDWWIGAEDRWHFPSEDVGVRQRLVELTPVVETAMRIPGGDAVHRAYAVPGGPGGSDLAVIEIENRTPTPFAVALAIRPYNPDGLAEVRAIEVDGRTVLVDGHPALLLPREPARAAAGTLREGDSAAVVTDGGAPAAVLDPVSCEAGLAQAAFLFPLAHTAVLRVAMPIAPARRRFRLQRRRRSTGAPVLDASLPTSAAVVAGWQAHSRQGMRLELPPGRLADAVQANRRFLLLEEDRDLVAVDVGSRGRGALEGLDRHDRIEGLRGLYELLDAASDTFSWPEPGTALTFLSLARHLLVREVPGGLALCSALPEGWVGQPLEVHDVPTEHGSVSFAVRWHGDRPALLWDLRAADGVGPVTISAPGLDPTWQSTELRGDALLNAVPLPATP